MATKALLSFQDPSGVVTADTGKTPNTVPLRDNNGGTSNGPSSFDQLSTPIWTPGVHSTITTSATLDASAVIIPVDATAAAVTITLPSAAGSARFFFIVKTDSSAHNVIVTDGTNTIATITAQYGKAHALSNGTVWM